MDDPRYAAFGEMHAVMHYDNKEAPEVVAATRELAEQYVAGQWSDENLSIEPVKVIRYLPPSRKLYELRGKVPYGPQAEPAPEKFDFDEFPGLGNGAIVPIEEISASIQETEGFGWHVNVWGWDRPQAVAAYEETMAEARRLRDERREVFGRFVAGCVARTAAGETLIRTVNRNGVPCWNSSSGVVHDAMVDPGTLTLVAGPPDKSS